MKASSPISRQGAESFHPITDAATALSAPAAHLGNAVGGVVAGAVGGPVAPLGDVVGTAAGAVGGPVAPVGGLVGSVGDVVGGVTGPAGPMTILPPDSTLPRVPSSGPQSAAPGSGAQAVDVAPASHAAPGSGVAGLAGDAASTAAGGVAPGSDPLAAVPGFGPASPHPIGGNGFGDPVTAFSSPAGPGAGATPLAPHQPFTLPRPSAADFAAGGPAPPPGSGQGSAAIDAVTQFAADNRLLVTAGLAGLVGAALIGPRSANVAALADVTFTNVRLIPCIVKDGAVRGGSAVAGGVRNGPTLVLESADRAVNAVKGAHEAGREVLTQAGRSFRDGFGDVIDGRPRLDTKESEWHRLGVIIAIVYLALISLCLGFFGARRAQESKTS